MGFFLISKYWVLSARNIYIYIYIYTLKLPGNIYLDVCYFIVHYGLKTHRVDNISRQFVIVNNLKGLVEKIMKGRVIGNNKNNLKGRVQQEDAQNQI